MTTSGISSETSYAVIDPKAYGQWDGLLNIFEGLRNDHPAARIENGDLHEPFWLISRHDDVMRISKDNETFLNNPRAVVFGLNDSENLIKAVTGGSPHLVNSLVALDAPIHPKYRRLTQEWFMPKNLKLMEDELTALAKRTVDKFIASSNSGAADFVPLVSAPYPLHVVMQILGVPESDEQRMLFLTQQMFGGQDEDLSNSGMANMTSEQVTQLVVGAVADFEAYFAMLTAKKRARPTKDVASVIANAMVDGAHLNDRDMAGYYIILAAAGHDTTSASTAGAMLALSQDPEQFAQLKADRSLLPGIVEEAIRWTTPVQHFMRTAARDVEVAGTMIKQGEWLMLSYVSANHDERVFDNPRKFDASRSPNRHVAFGAGAHQCLGLHMARLEMKILFNELLDRLDHIELAGEPKRANSTFVGGLKTLPLKFTAS
jgi:cytochrome P450